MSLTDIKDLGIGLVTLFVLYQMVIGRNSGDNQQNKILDKTLSLFGSLTKAFDQHTEALAALITKATSTETLVMAQAEALGMQSRAVAKIQGDVHALPIDISLMLTEHQVGIVRQFEPVVKALGAISIGVDAQNKALLELRQREQERRTAESVILTTQHELNEQLVRAEKSLQAIFEAVLANMSEVNDGSTDDRLERRHKHLELGSWSSSSAVATSEHTSEQGKGNAGSAESAGAEKPDAVGRPVAEGRGNVERTALPDAETDSEREPAASEAKRGSLPEKAE